MKTARLWYAGKQSRELEIRPGHIVPHQVRTKFLVLEWNGTDRVYAFAHFQFGEARKFGTVDTLERAIRQVRLAYQESADENVPLVVVLERPKVRSTTRDALCKAAKAEINGFKTQRMKELVALPRVLEVERRHVDRLLFGDRDLPVDDRRQLEREYVAQTCDLPVPEDYAPTRVLCAGAWISRSELAVEITSKDFRNREPARFADA